jgi:hypothetical protein
MNGRAFRGATVRGNGRGHAASGPGVCQARPDPQDTARPVFSPAALSVHGAPCPPPRGVQWAPGVSSVRRAFARAPRRATPAPHPRTHPGGHRRPAAALPVVRRPDGQSPPAQRPIVWPVRRLQGGTRAHLGRAGGGTAGYGKEVSYSSLSKSRLLHCRSPGQTIGVFAVTPSLTT